MTTIPVIMQAKVYCNYCLKDWVAEMEFGTDPKTLECPRCHSFDSKVEQCEDQVPWLN